jgi:predicted transposase YbfD/YdcC
LTVKANQQTLYRQIRSQFQGKRKIPFVATDHEISHGRDITWTLRAKQALEHISETWIGTSWIVEVRPTGTHDGKPFCATTCSSSLRTTPETLLQLVRERWSIEGWHWIRETQLQEDAHCYRGNGAGALTTLRTAALNLLRLNAFHSIRASNLTLTHDETLNQPWPLPSRLQLNDQPLAPYRRGITCCSNCRCCRSRSSDRSGWCSAGRMPDRP